MHTPIKKTHFDGKKRVLDNKIQVKMNVNILTDLNKIFLDLELSFNNGGQGLFLNRNCPSLYLKFSEICRVAFDNYKEIK